METSPFMLIPAPRSYPKVRIVLHSSGECREDVALRTIPLFNFIPHPRFIHATYLTHRQSSRLALGYAIIVKRLANYFQNIVPTAY